MNTNLCILYGRNTPIISDLHHQTSPKRLSLPYLASLLDTLLHYHTDSNPAITKFGHGDFSTNQPAKPNHFSILHSLSHDGRWYARVSAQQYNIKEFKCWKKVLEVLRQVQNDPVLYMYADWANTNWNENFQNWQSFSRGCAINPTCL